tara:strand:+ start:639 stop:821 length:183 start_codon:yes stop_codon:yes gene_type:complete
MNKIIKALEDRYALRETLVAEMEEQHMDIDWICELEYSQEGYQLAIKELKELIKGGKHED